jgi:hypothetical protein
VAIPGTTANASASLDAGDQSLSTAEVPFVIATPAPTVTKSVAVNDPLPGGQPIPGDLLTYTITIEGLAAAGTVISIEDVLPAALLVRDVRIGEASNVSEGVTSSGQTVTASYVVVEGGAYRVTVEIDATVRVSVKLDTVIANTVCVDLADGPQDTCATVTISTPRVIGPIGILRYLVALLLAGLNGEL